MTAKLLSFSRIYIPPISFSGNYTVGIAEFKGKKILVRISDPVEKLKVGVKGFISIKSIKNVDTYFFSLNRKLKKESRVVVITGSTRGIGKSIAIALAKNGFNVVINSREDNQEAKNSLREIRSFNKKAIYIQADVSVHKEVINLINRTINTFGYIDLLINNAGIRNDNLIENMSEEDWEIVMSNNLKSMFLCIKEVVPFFKERARGRIINISSVIGHTGNIGQVNYSSAKAGIFGLTKSLAKELAPYNILVNTIAPGFIDTNMTADIKSSLKQEITSKIPLSRFGQPKDISNAVLFLSNEENDYITGEILNINGGLY